MKKQTQTDKAQTIDKPDTETEKYLQVFGKERYLSACSAAEEAIGQVRAADTIIETQRSGNAKLIMGVAVRCVELCTKNKRADLPLAAELMKAACRHAEDVVVANYANETGTEQRIDAIVPSWPPMKSIVVNAMKKAGVNPGKLKDYGAVKKAYAEFTKSNPETKDTRGAKARVTDKPAKSAGDSGASLVPHPIAKQISKGVQKAVAALMFALAKCDKGTQDEAQRRIEALVADYTAKGQKDEETGKETRRPRKPANEPADTGAQAD